MDLCIGRFESTAYFQLSFGNDRRPQRILRSGQPVFRAQEAMDNRRGFCRAGGPDTR